MKRDHLLIRKAVVFGAGTMGRRIACLLSRNLVKTVLSDPSERALARAGEECGAHAGVELTTGWEEHMEDADLIIESIPEVLTLKRQLLHQIAPFVHEHTLVASNTSSFSLAVLSEGLAFAERMLLMHFFNPADLVPLVELVKPDDMDAATVSAVVRLLKDCGKVPVVLKKGVDGFVANRLQAAVLREACSLVQQGIADAADIDTVVKTGIGLRWAVSGPFEIADYGGLDIWEKVLAHLLPELDNTREVPQVIRRHIGNNELGFKTGKGFYEHCPERDVPDWRGALAAVLAAGSNG